MKSFPIFICLFYQFSSLQMVAFIKAMEDGGVILSEPQEVFDFREPIDYFPEEYWVKYLFGRVAFWQNRRTIYNISIGRLFQKINWRQNWSKRLRRYWIVWFLFVTVEGYLASIFWLLFVISFNEARRICLFWINLLIVN